MLLLVRRELIAQARIRHCVKQKTISLLNNKCNGGRTKQAASHRVVSDRDDEVICLCDDVDDKDGGLDNADVDDTVATAVLAQPHGDAQQPTSVLTGPDHVVRSVLLHAYTPQ